MRRRFSCFAVILAIFLTSFTGFAQQKPPANPDVTTPQQAATEPSATTNEKESGEAVDIHKYLIGPQDIIFVRVWREPDFTGPQTVRPDGNITLPLIGEVRAGGLTPVQLSDKIHESLLKLINNPDVSVTVAQVNSKKYYIDGEVYRPGEYRLITPTTILAALSEAGGFKDFANPKKIRVLRGTQTFKFNYKEVSHGKSMEQNIYLENGDHIIVP